MSQPQILSPNQPMTDGNGKVTHDWWRALHALFKSSGTLAAGVTVKGSAVLAETVVNSGGTIAAPDAPGATLIGNAGPAAAQPGYIPVDPSLSLAGGALALPTLPAAVLWGNPTYAPAKPVTIRLGAGVEFSGGMLVVPAGAAGSDASAYAVPDRSGQVADLERRVAFLETLLLSLPDVRGRLAEIERRLRDDEIRSTFRSWGH